MPVLSSKVTGVKLAPWYLVTNGEPLDSIQICVIVGSLILSFFFGTPNEIQHPSKQKKTTEENPSCLS